MTWAQWATAVTVVAAVGKEKPCTFSSAKAQKQACYSVRSPQRIAYGRDNATGHSAEDSGHYSTGNPSTSVAAQNFLKALGQLRSITLSRADAAMRFRSAESVTSA